VRWRVWAPGPGLSSKGEERGLDMAGMVCAWPWLGLPRVLLRFTMLVLVREGTRGPIGVGWGRLDGVESL
jgi:hypothetical protein